MSTQEVIKQNGYYRSQNWFSQVQRYPFLQNPYRFPGYQAQIQLPPALQDTCRIVKSQLAPILGICGCVIEDGQLLNIAPNTNVEPFQNTPFLLATIDMQTGDLWISRDPLVLARPDWTDWQYFLQFNIRA